MAALKLPQTGILPNALPRFYLNAAEDGGLWVMQDHSTGDATGRQQFLAHIPKAVLEACATAREPQGLRL